MKTAYVLAGGGAKGSYQVGVMQFLHEQGILPDVLYGTSVGALNAAGYAYGGIKLLRQTWDSIKSPRDVMRFNWSFLWCNGMYNTKPLQQKIDEIVTGNSKIEAVVTRVNMCDGNVAYVSSKENSNPVFAQAVLASASLPAIMEPVGDWIDGSVREVTPVNKAIDDGADRIIVIMTNPIEGSFGKFKKPSGFLSALKIGYRALDIMQTEVMLNDIRGAQRVNKMIQKGRMLEKKLVEVEIYAPSKLVLQTLDFNKDLIKLGIKQGYEETKLKWGK